jgi:hypothetical protein
MFCWVLLKLPPTFLGLAKVGFRKYQSSNLVQKLIESTNVQPSTKAPLLPNPSYVCIIIKFNNKSKPNLERTKAE